MPTKYILELCDTSGEHKPIVCMASDTPFPAVHVGERFDDVGWARLDGVTLGSLAQPRRYIVHSIKHLVFPSEDGLIAKYCLNLEPYLGPGSPVWGDD